MHSLTWFSTQPFRGAFLWLAIANTLCIADTNAADFLKSSYPGARIISHHKSNYAENIFLLLSTPRAKNNMAHVDKTEKLHGALETTVFSHRESDSEIEIHESYKQALIKAGYAISFFCPPGCYSPQGAVDWDEVMEKYVPPVGDGVMPVTNISYLAAIKGNVYVMILAGGATSGEPPISVVTTVIVKPMNTSGPEINQGFVSAAEIGSRLQQEGRIALYGVYFDTGKAELKPQSRPVLNEIVRFLRQNPAMRLYVVGHTDDSGNYQNNMELSDKRAALVVARYRAAWRHQPCPSTA